MPPPLPAHIRSRADVERMLAEATNYEQRIPDGPQAFDLRRMQALLERLGRPDQGFTPVHVAGSKGKGSTVRMVAAALLAAGRGPVGLYTSPHLSDLTERIALDGQPADEASFLAACARLLPAVRALQGSAAAPTFFELLTAAAWLVFQAHGCRDVVLETGLGGRLDATTVCRPAVTAITTIEREHTRLLGDTLEQIAGEKAGILKPGVPCVTGATGVALEVIAERARRLGARLEVVDRDLTLERVHAREGPATEVSLRRGAERVEFTLPLAGAHQARNAAVAYGLLRHLGLPPEVAARGLESVRLPAALEPLPGPPLVVLDGAHTVESARAARQGLAAAWPERPFVLLLALMAEKEVEAIVALLARGALAVVATAVDSPRALPAQDLAQRLRTATSAPVEALTPPSAALRRALDLTPADGLLLVTGSLYLAGALRPLLLARQEPGGRVGSPRDPAPPQAPSPSTPGS